MGALGRAPASSLTARYCSADVSWSSIPTHLLLAEITRRQDATAKSDERPACGSGERGAYDTPLHVFALVLILTLSTLGTRDLPLCSLSLHDPRHPSDPLLLPSC